ncbi:BACON domain-containing protein [Longimicrobium sp.]|uniref:BACON domain-containing protein n=1 Tax=Longimicrobium sp. TaxID=2029185 RepID=UPI002BEDA23A|nr:choice-of-anchor D domain-containing protein [Longimicrobium sp.]HSU14349.1 choice-of-anchor D domain-containing protein [Longimicrobium sp.]
MRRTTALLRLASAGLVLFVGGCDAGGANGPGPVGPDPTPAVGVGTTALAFAAQEGAASATQTLAVTNTGGGTLSWSAAESMAWLTLSPSGGTLGPGASASVAITVNTAGMAPGRYSGVVELSGGGGGAKAVTITLDVTQAPALAASTASLSFSVQPGAAPPPQSLIVSNTGGGSLAWSASSASSWLIVSPSTGSLAGGSSAALAVSVSAAGLAAGTYSGTVDLNAPGATGAPQHVAVQLTVAPGPALAVSASPLAFFAQVGANAAPQTVTLSNTGGGTLGWSAVEAVPWLTVSPPTGSLGAGASAQVTVTVNTAGLAQGTYSGTIDVSAPGASGSPRSIPVTLTVSSAPVLGVSATTFSFAALAGTNPAAQPVTITNTGGGTLAWSASDDAPWLTVTPASGSLASNAGAQAALSVSTAGLAAGTYHATVTLTAPGAGGSPRALAVTLAVSAPPAVSVNPASLSFSAAQGSNPATQSVIVTNTGGGSLVWTASSNAAWLAATPGSGTLAGGGAVPVTLSVSSAGLAAGTYNGAVTISAPGATGSPKTVAVSLTVAAGPALGVSAASLGFATQQGSPPPPQSFTVSNTGGGSLAWSASSNASWATVSPAGGSLAGGSSAPVTVSIDPTGLGAGTWNATIDVSAPGAAGSPKSVGVSLTIAAGPSLSVSPPSVSFSAAQGSSAASQTVTVTNTGGGTLSWSADESIAWLSLSPTSGTLGAGQSAQVTLSPNTAGLAAGPYPGSIDFSAPGADGSPRSVGVDLTVTGPTLLPAPSLGSPANGATGVSTTPTFSWSPVAGANHYWVTIATSASALPTDPGAATCAGCVISVNTTSTSYTATASLAAGTTYYWRVQGWNNSTSPYTQGQYSPVWSFVSAAAAPRLLVDGSLSSSKAPGQTFSVTGGGYTPNRTVTRYLKDPSGNIITLSPILSADGSGNIAWTFTPVCTTPAVTSTLWVVDDATGKSSNTVSQTVTAGGGCGDSGFTWPVDPSNSSNGFNGACGDWPGDSNGCFWISSNGWRDVQPFLRHLYDGHGYHLGADWNKGSGSDDANLPVYAVANGTVSDVRTNVSGWGNIIFVRHVTSFGIITSMYAHVNWNTSGPPAKGQTVSKGQQIARVGNGNGLYPYHLHLEIRVGDNVTPGPGYLSSRTATPPQGQIDPDVFIATHR